MAYRFLKRAAVVLISLSASTLIRILLRPVLHDKASLLPFTLAVIASSYYGGLVPGLVATFLGAAIADYFFIQPVGQIMSAFPGDFVLFAIFVIFGVSVSVLNHAVSRAMEAMRKTNERIELAASVASIGFREWRLPGQQADYQAWLEQVHPEDRERVSATIKDALEKHQREFTCDYRIQLPDGSVRYCEGRSRVVEGEPGRPRRVVGADIDITERKQLELELERFAHSAAHDLQEPLRGIRTYSERVLAVNRDQLDPTSFRLMEYVVESAARMQDLIRAILDYASSGKQGADERAPVDLRKAVDAALIHLRSSIEESGARIDIGDLPVIEGIERDFVRIFQNLIGNGLKYRRESAPVISVSAVRPPGGQWIVSVADNGIGIDPKYHKRIFETFQRVHSRSKYEGTGLGLATCKRIVQQYGGRMWVESEPDKGATFRFTLPEAVAISRKPPQRSDPQPDRAKSLGV